MIFYWEGDFNDTTVPCATKTLPTRKNSTRIIFEITVTRFEFFRINFGKVTRYLLFLCELRDITRLEPRALPNYFLLPLPDLKFSELIG